MALIFWDFKNDSKWRFWIFQFWHFFTNFCYIKRDLSGNTVSFRFQKTPPPKWSIFGTLINFCLVKIWLRMRLFLWFQTSWTCLILPNLRLFEPFLNPNLSKIQRRKCLKITGPEPRKSGPLSRQLPKSNYLVNLETFFESYEVTSMETKCGTKLFLAGILRVLEITEGLEIKSGGRYYHSHSASKVQF